MPIDYQARVFAKDYAKNDYSTSARWIRGDKQRAEFVAIRSASYQTVKFGQNFWTKRLRKPNMWHTAFNVLIWQKAGLFVENLFAVNQ